MRPYELTYLKSLDPSEEEQKNLSEKVISAIQENGGILKESSQPLRQRNYFAITLNFYCEPANISTIKEKLRSEPQIIRFMILHKEVSKTKFKPPRKRPVEDFLTKAEKKPGEKKVELKEIEKKLEEILKD